MAAGHTHKSGDYAQLINKAVQTLMRSQDVTGSFFQTAHGTFQFGEELEQAWALGDLRAKGRLALHYRICLYHFLLPGG